MYQKLTCFEEIVLLDPVGGFGNLASTSGGRVWRARPSTFRVPPENLLGPVKSMIFGQHGLAEKI